VSVDRGLAPLDDDHPLTADSIPSDADSAMLAPTTHQLYELTSLSEAAVITGRTD
jgi:hypothetical protein